MLDLGYGYYRYVALVDGGEINENHVDAAAPSVRMSRCASYGEWWCVIYEDGWRYVCV